MNTSATVNERWWGCVPVFEIITRKCQNTLEAVTMSIENATS